MRRPGIRNGWLTASCSVVRDTISLRARVRLTTARPRSPVSWNARRSSGEISGMRAKEVASPEPRQRGRASQKRVDANGHASGGRLAHTMMNASGSTVPVTEWDRLSAESRAEVEHLQEVLK